MTSEPIDLDGRRTVTGQREAELRRQPANSVLPPDRPGGTETAALEDEFLEAPARTWTEVLGKWRFLLERYAETPEAADDRLRTLTRRALADMDRLEKREDRE